MSVDRPGETEAELVDRRGREADERFRAHVASFPPPGERVPATVAGQFSSQDIANGRG
jgi:hypothetical protein